MGVEMSKASAMLVDAIDPVSRAKVRLTKDLHAANSAEGHAELFDVVSFGARDYYEVAVALNQAGMLHKLYTDWYTPDFARRWVQARYNPDLSSNKTRSLWIFAALALVMRRIPPSWYAARASYRWLNYVYGFCCGAACYFAGPNQAIVYSYYLEGFLAFYRATGRRPDNLICFQVHPAPAYVQRKLREDANAYGALQPVAFTPDAEEDLSEAARQSYARALAACQTVICASSISRESIADIAGEARIDIVPYGSRFGENEVREPASLQPTGPIRLLSICQLTQRKGMHWAFRAMAELPREVQDRFDWRIVSAKRDPAIAAMAPSNVAFTDWLSQADLAVEFKKSDLFVMPSLVEGFGLVYLESLSFGTPVLYTDRTGAADFCVAGAHGFKVPVSDWRVLSEVLRRCAADPGVLSAMRRECHGVARNYTWDRFRVGIRSACSENIENGLPTTRARVAASSDKPSAANGIDGNQDTGATRISTASLEIGGFEDPSMTANNEIRATALPLSVRALQLVLMNVRPAPVASFVKKIIGIQRRVITTANARYFIDPFSHFGYHLSTNGDYEPEMRTKLEALLKPGDTFVDLGANEGYFSVIASKLVTSSGRVLAIEPQRRLKSIIQKNAELNMCNNIALVTEVISDQVGDVMLNLASDMNTGSSGVYRAARYKVSQQAAKTTTLTNIFRDMSIDHVSLMKVDIEGFEYEALLGSADIFREKRITAIALELHPEILRSRGKSVQNILDMLHDSGYREAPNMPSVWTIAGL